MNGVSNNPTRIMYGRKTGKVIPVLSLASFPRSGNKFAQQILHHMYGLKCRTIYPVPSYPDEIAPTWDGIEQNVILKTHELYSEETGIYIIRDPRDVYCSYAKYLNVTPISLIDSSWSEHVLSWQQPNIQIIRYEDLLIDPTCIMPKETPIIGKLPYWEDLHTICPWYYQCGKSGRWKNELTKNEVDKCMSINREIMKQYGYL